VNVRETQENTPEGRIAASARVVMMRSIETMMRVPDYADLRDGIRSVVQRELMIAELKGLAVDSEIKRSDRRREILLELAPGAKRSNDK
jgi:hypothetical protein